MNALKSGVIWVTHSYKTRADLQQQLTIYLLVVP